jgi:uncharacterized membrane protein
VTGVHEIGPVQLISMGFDRGANFEGRITDELARLESERTIRVLDLLFIARDTDSEEIVVLEHSEGGSLGQILGELLGIELDSGTEQGATGGGEEHAFGLSQDDIQQMANGLGPGESAGLLLIEHVWARSLRRAMADAGGRVLADGFLTPQTIAQLEPQLAALAARVADSERGAAGA